MSDSLAPPFFKHQDSIPLLRNMSIVSAVPGNLCSPDQSTPILLVSSAGYSIHILIILPESERSDQFVDRWVERTIAIEEEDLDVCQYVYLQTPCLSQATHIELINESLNTGLIASQVLGLRHAAHCSECEAFRLRES